MTASSTRAVRFSLIFLMTSLISANVKNPAITRLSPQSKPALRIDPDIALGNNKRNFSADCELYGFTVGSQWKPVYSDEGSFWTDKNEYREAGKLNHYSEVNQVLLQRKDCSYAYAFIYRVTVSPNQCRNWGFMGIGSDSDNWYFRDLDSVCQLDNGKKLTTYSPTNALVSGSISMSVGSSAGSSGAEGSVSCAISYNWDELSITSLSNIGKNKYETFYKDEFLSTYTAHDSFYYGMFLFECHSTPKMTIKHTIHYYGDAYYKANSAAGTVTFQNTFAG